MNPLTYFVNILGILIGTLTMELGGMVTINCEKTGYHADVEFKLKVCIFLFIYYFIVIIIIMSSCIQRSQACCQTRCLVSQV